MPANFSSNVSSDKDISAAGHRFAVTRASLSSSPRACRAAWHHRNSSTADTGCRLAAPARPKAQRSYDASAWLAYRGLARRAHGASQRTTEAGRPLLRPVSTRAGIATRPTRFLERLLIAGVWFRSALADCLDQGFKSAPMLFDAPRFGGLPFRSPLLFAKPALVLTHQLYQSRRLLGRTASHRHREAFRPDRQRHAQSPACCRASPWNKWN